MAYGRWQNHFHGVKIVAHKSDIEYYHQSMHSTETEPLLIYQPANETEPLLIYQRANERALLIYQLANERALLLYQLANETGPLLIYQPANERAATDLPASQ